MKQKSKKCSFGKTWQHSTMFPKEWREKRQLAEVWAFPVVSLSSLSSFLCPLMRILLIFLRWGGQEKKLKSSRRSRRCMHLMKFYSLECPSGRTHWKLWISDGFDKSSYLDCMSILKLKNTEDHQTGMKTLVTHGELHWFWWCFLFCFLFFVFITVGQDAHRMIHQLFGVGNLGTSSLLNAIPNL